MSEKLLEVKGLKAYYRTRGNPVRAVDDVSFYVRHDEIFGIAGESGCGKSTLALAITRLLKPPGYIEGGEVLYNGINLVELDEEELRRIRWKEISYIPQSSMNALNPVKNVKDQIADAIKAHEEHVEDEEIDERIEELLTSVGLAPEVARMYPHELSGGMRQRVIIAMSIALNPRLIIADEPTTALDVVVQRGIIQLLEDVKERLKSSIILITHDMAVHAELVDRLAVMYAGKIVEIGDVKAAFRDPLHPYAKALIEAIPSIKGRKMLKGLPGFPPDLRNPPPGCRFAPRCPYAMDVCRRVEPRLIKISDRYVACHLYGERA